MPTNLKLGPVETALKAANLKITGANIAEVLHRVPAKSVHGHEIDYQALQKAATIIAAEKNIAGTKPSQALEKVTSHLPKALSRYALNFDPGFDAQRLFIRAAFDRPVFAERTAKAMGDSPAKFDNNNGLQLTDAAGHVRNMINGKILSGQSLERLFAHRDMDLQALKKAGFNLTEPRTVLAVTVEGSQEPIFLVFRDKKNFHDREVDVPGSPPFADKTRAVAVLKTHCDASVHELGSPIVAKKPVIYLYPESRTAVRVNVKLTQGEFIAQYPETKNGTWNVIAMPDGTLIDRTNEKRFSYLFWEGTVPRGFEIDPAQAFCVKSADVERFLENACTRFGLNDRERTDFISYWIAPLKRNPISLVQFLSSDQYDSYAQMTIEPHPQSWIRLFMIFERTRELVQTGNPELPAIKRHRFTVVEWGGSNLDER